MIIRNRIASQPRLFKLGNEGFALREVLSKPRLVLCNPMIESNDVRVVKERLVLRGDFELHTVVDKGLHHVHPSCFDD